MPLLSLSKFWFVALCPVISVDAWVSYSQAPLRPRAYIHQRNDGSTKSRFLPSQDRKIQSSLLIGQATAAPSSSDGTNALPEITLFNSLIREKEGLKPIQDGKFSMYTCGPTVYDYAHVGNFRAFLTYDVVKRALQYFGYDVTHICNITDVDDKIIKRATELGMESALELTQKFEKLFMQDLKALNIIPASKYPRATEHVDEMMDMIATLHEKELAYETPDGSWYFRTQSQDGYGQQLVQFSSEASEEYNAEQTQVENEDGKENFQDFCLWKAYKPGVDRDDLIWERPPLFKMGRPGWHLECSAMARKYLGDTIDLHGGGIDLKFPHHENEIAQSEGCTGSTFCNCWFHNGFVNINAEKMSKSLGNFLTLSVACPSAVEVRAYRYLVVTSQYRAALNFSPDAMKGAKSALKRIDAVQNQLSEALKDNSETSGDSDSKLVTETVPKAIQNFEAALKDDLSMPRAAASLFGLVKAAETEFKKVAKNTDAELDLAGLAAIQSALQQMDQVFGIFYEVPDTHTSEAEQAGDDASIPDEVMDLVNQRTVAKESKDWDLADSLRGRITELGYAVKDVKGGEPVVTLLD